MGQHFPWDDPTPNGGLRAPAQTNCAAGTNNAAASTTLAASSITGAAVFVALAMTGALAAGATATTDTAANIIAALPGVQRYVGCSYRLRIINESSGNFVWTLAAGAGVTITGTKTIAQNTWREFVVTIASATTVTMQNVGTGTYS